MSTYVGSELEIFQHARNWKAYYGGLVAPFLGDDVLEVGAGIGATTSALTRGTHRRWLCLEPDAALAERIREDIRKGALPPYCEVAVGTTESLADETFDSILYLDVLEHIADDRAELERAVRLLRAGGHLIILAPAHQTLFTPFDEAIGHHRRYDRRGLQGIMPRQLASLVSRYLDSAGIALSLANRLLLRARMPTQRQIEFWDRFVVPISRRLDPLLRYRVGKSLLEVGRLEAK